MVDNFVKYISIIPDVLYDDTIEDLNFDSIRKVFDSYEKLSNISTSQMLKSGSKISFIEVSNSLYEYILNHMIISEGHTSVVSKLCVNNEKRNIILCLSLKSYTNYIKMYKNELKDQLSNLIIQINTMMEEVNNIDKLDIEV